MAHSGRHKPKSRSQIQPASDLILRNRSDALTLVYRLYSACQVSLYYQRRAWQVVLATNKVGLATGKAQSTAHNGSPEYTLARKDYIHKFLFLELISRKITFQLQEYIFLELTSRKLHYTHSSVIQRIIWKIVWEFISWKISFQLHETMFSELSSQQFLAGV